MASITRTIIFFCLLETILHSLKDIVSRINMGNSYNDASLLN